MFGSLVASQDILAQRFQLQPSETKVLPAALAWLHSENPWFAAYRSSCAEVKNVVDAVTTLRDRGTLVARAPSELRSKQDQPLQESLGSDGASGDDSRQ